MVEVVREAGRARSYMNVKVLLYLFLALWQSLISACNGQTTAFNYQGRLLVSGAPATGAYELEFVVYDSPTGGTQQGPPQTNQLTIVSNGLFAVTLDFGPGVFTGATRWLQIGLRTNSASAFDFLSPRQNLLASPYALYAQDAGTALTSARAVSSQTFAGQLEGDVYGPQSGTRVVKVGGETAAAIGESTLAVKNATAENVPNTIVKRDSAGNFSIGNLTAIGTIEAQGNLTVAGTVMATNGFLSPVFIGPASYRALEPDGIAEAYCRKAQIVSQNARQAIHDFASGLQRLGVLTNLADFAFFCQGQNTVAANPVSWQSEGTVVGTVKRLRGGLEFPNYSGKNHIFFTNLPPTPDGRTLVFWGAGSRSPSSSAATQDAAATIADLTSAGPWPPATVLQLGSYNGGYGVLTWNASIARFGPAWYPPAGVTGNVLFCAALSCSPDGQTMMLKRDYPATTSEYSNTDKFTIEPTVIRFGAGIAPAQTNGWWGLVRGFAYFNRPLSIDQVEQIDRLVPRIGAIVEGDSKSVYPQVWWEYWCNAPNTWGLLSVRTNSAQSGTMVSERNSLAFYRSAGLSMEARFAANAANFPINPQYPLTLFALRGGHNDLNITNSDQVINNAVTSITNLWARARTQGWQAIGWTVDRTRITWQSTNVFPSGASNALIHLNSALKTHSSLCDALVDAENFYASAYGPLPYTNKLLYWDEVHDSGGSAPLGTNALNNWASPSLGYEVPPQAGAVDPSLGNRLPSQILSSGGWTANPSVNSIAFPQTASPPSPYEIGGSPGSVTNHLLRNIGGVMFDFWSDGAAVWSKPLAP